MSGVAVSVIVPTHNRPEQLARCLETLAALDGPDGGWEVIVVNDGGSPVAAAVGAGGPAVRLLEQPQAGPAAARNTGAGAAVGRVLVFTDDDCEPLPGWLEALQARVDTDPDAVVGGRIVPADEENSWAAASQLLIDHLYRWYNRDPARARFVTSNNLALTAATFAELGGFHTGFPNAAAEDREFAERTVRLGHALVFAPEAVVRHRHRLTAGSFLRQQHGYGRGAHRLLRVRQDAGGGVIVESPRFYTELLRTPFGRAEPARSLRLAVLLLASQAAHATGFAREAVAARSARRTGRGGSRPDPR